MFHQTAPAISVLEVERTGKEPELRLVKQRDFGRHAGQTLRREGEKAFYGDRGNTRFTCETCHYRGHFSSLVTTASPAYHIYRATPLDGVRETSPYFSQFQIPTLFEVGARLLPLNRFHHVESSADELAGLAAYQAALVSPPNPYLFAASEDPKALKRVSLPDGTQGNARRGLALFEGEAGCIECHPPPAFTLDQSATTRGQHFDVGTQVALAFKEDLQDRKAYDLPPPSLVSVWSHFPLLHSGEAGFEVRDQGLYTQAEPALWTVLALARDSGKHGQISKATDQDLRDLWAFLLTL